MGVPIYGPWRQSLGAGSSVWQEELARPWGLVYSNAAWLCVTGKHPTLSDSQPALGPLGALSAVIYWDSRSPAQILCLEEDLGDAEMGRGAEKRPGRAL